ncbi:hypothetical protein EI555_005922 [Monodon monoceros]|uniref:B box-type domain-containing protein n=1 Tax=Monodon monoceros TaxID=40151 RepID=A0A4U1EXI9_MONMO|nr:hypothetical protein EI555_005922 [Monodon monoceros]
MSKRLCSQLEQEIPEDVCCEIHLDPPQLFCHDDQITICDKYFKSQEHKNHVVYGVQEAAENYRKLFQEILNTLKEELEVTKSILADEQGRMVMMQEEEQNFKVMIESEYRIRWRNRVDNASMNLTEPEKRNERESRFFASLTTKGAYDLDHRINVERNSPEMLYWPEEYVKSAKNFAPRPCTRESM